MEKTTLILGAGFSIPYGYPSGKNLIKHIREMKNVDGSPTIDRLKHTIKYTKIRSIDSFLNAHKDFHSVGIEQIALKLYNTERNYLLRSLSPAEEKDFDSKDIVELLLNSINEDDFHKFKIITFNYDRHLEWSFYMKLLYKYQGDKKAAMQALGKLEIVHVHGSMIPFSKFKTDGTELQKGQWVPYGVQIDYEDDKDICMKETYLKVYLQYAQDNIQTIYTNTVKNEKIESILQGSTRVFFLGFAFEERNMALLGINPENVNKRVPYYWSGKTVYGTCYDMETVEINKIKRLFPFLGKQKLKRLNCRELFSNEFSLENPLDDHSDNVNSNKHNCCDLTAIENFTYGEAEKAFRYTNRLRQDINCLACGKTRTRYFDRTVSNDWNLDRNI